MSKTKKFVCRMHHDLLNPVLEVSPKRMRKYLGDLIKRN